MAALFKALSIFRHAVINARWVNACGKLPRASPVDPISSVLRPIWLEYVSVFSSINRASSKWLVRARDSAIQKLQAVKVPSALLGRSLVCEKMLLGPVGVWEMEISSNC